MTDPEKILCTMACFESLRNHQEYLEEGVGSLVGVLQNRE
jgi:hypothetical protein